MVVYGYSMASTYNHIEVEKRWQTYWDEQGVHNAHDISKKPHTYILDMFPYPSGAGLHVGHPKGYTATDITARYMRMNGKEVLHPMGWDAFGLPAENYAIKQKVHPAKTTTANIATFKRQIKSLGFSYDWTREFSTADPDYYTWTQWLFLALYKYGLAYRKKALVNWCPSCQTVLAREQVVGGACERCGTTVIQQQREQWFLKITQYADQLLHGLDTIQWPDSIKSMQRNWIGRSEGVRFSFEIEALKGGKKQYIEVFTTRPDTLEGATYLVLAPDHPLVEEITSAEKKEEVRAYNEMVAKKTELERTDLAKDKTGVFLGAHAINPLTKEVIPIWISDYVLSSYGTGAIMAVPAHDTRDGEFAAKFNLPVKQIELRDANTVIGEVGGVKEVRYKMRDWLISRQRYWGAPIPIIYCDACGMVPVPEKDLPVLLPEDVDFLPTGESPLARSKEFSKVECPTCGKPARREFDTMDTFMCSSWYYLRFCDPNDEEKAFSGQKVKEWMPVDLYVGGAEHAVLHLLYARFITRALHELGYVTFDEPFTVLRNVGLILAEDNFKMSKSRGNVINPDDIVHEYGADTLRMYEMFMGPFEDAVAWNTMGVRGMRRFLQRVWDVHDALVDTTFKDAILLHKTIQKVGADIERFSFNTAVSSLMILCNALERDPSRNAYEIFITLLAPFAPHIAEELWNKLGHKEGLTYVEWPKEDTSILATQQATWVVQINGKTRGTLVLPPEATQDEVLARAHDESKLKGYLESGDIVKVIFVQGKLVNVVLAPRGS